MEKIVVALLLIVLSFAIACEVSHGRANTTQSVFHVDGRIPPKGTMLKSKLSGDMVQVVGYSRESALPREVEIPAGIKCRVASGRKIRDTSGWVSEAKDSYVQEYAIVIFKGYELEWLDKEE